jgi:hypothetical protein
MRGAGRVFFDELQLWQAGTQLVTSRGSWPVLAGMTWSMVVAFLPQ